MEERGAGTARTADDSVAAATLSSARGTAQKTTWFGDGAMDETTAAFLVARGPRTWAFFRFTGAAVRGGEELGAALGLDADEVRWRREAREVTEVEEDAPAARRGKGQVCLLLTLF